MLLILTKESQKVPDTQARLKLKKSNKSTTYLIYKMQ